MPEMRGVLRSQIGEIGCKRVVMSGTVKEALEQFKKNSFDIIISDYHLPGGTTGQQFLEYLRTRNVIGRAVIFVMVTSEKGFESVLSAAEHLPDAYLLKPFTPDALRSRLEGLLKRKQRLAKVDLLQDKRSWDGVVLACDQIIAAKDAYMVDALRIKGSALLASGRAETAVEFYRLMLREKSLPWAKLGLARALHMQGDSAGSEDILSDLIEDSPKFMAAYDVLGQLHTAMGKHDLALETLDKAGSISPNSLARQRAIASVAERIGNFKRVETALDHVIKKTKGTLLRESEDFARMGNALSENGKITQAVTLLEDARVTFQNEGNNPLLASVEAIVHQKAGNASKAEEALARALDTGEASALPNYVLMMVAKACLTNGKPNQAQQFLKVVVQNNPDSKDLHNHVSTLLKQHGAESLVDSVVSGGIQEIMALNNDAVRRARAGEFSAAAEILMDAAKRLPGNMLVSSNAAIALLNDVLQNGLEPSKIRKAQTLQQAVQSHSPGYPKLGEIRKLMVRVRNKFAPVPAPKKA
ncbi:MAG: hypothetical protein RIR18_816 [Pseudomonadota bacterium]